MDLVYIYESPFVRTPDGTIYSVGGNFSAKMFRRYLKVFDHVDVITRVRDDNGTYPANNKVECGNIKVHALPFYTGAVQFTLKYLAIRQQLKKHIRKDCAYIIRTPSVVGTIMSELLNRNKIPYGVEVVGDPYDAFSPESIQHPLRPVFRWKLKTDLQKIVRKAEAALFVTRDYLQERYPAAAGKYQTHASNVTLIDEAFVRQPKHYNGDIKEFNLISVGALAQMYKSPDIVLEAIKKLHGDGIDCHLTWLGDGKYMDDMIGLANELGIGENVSFEGRVNSGRNVRAYLDKADIFILASKTEGLPRAMIEAMARALPCVGSEVGGIPELLDEQVIVPAGDPYALAGLLKKMITNSAFLNEQSARNLEVAQSYNHHVLSRRREEFYRQVKSSVQIEN
ncbi:glycosyltransferase [Prolixibacter denitrificans]|uniref:Glycosyltransferase involved in cell wall biosynthesis n=1 Tax=Prolixibacter denitrificans TaxID=1541063 RepID=A0A2P8CDT7_9BACT|nr:glycosyltransferase [Prolixibacter denitrificans]PSK83131.1 glycosyltransferase involved in cell wall biosynthesis [Prolixibacter denitrificans]GET21986.1 hypothetical protein JCM18694_22320 [Prolixibacter denitrificans]